MVSGQGQQLGFKSSMMMRCLTVIYQDGTDDGHVTAPVHKIIYFIRTLSDLPQKEFNTVI